MLRLSWSCARAREKIVALLASNKLVIGTTDTIYGLYAPVTEQGFNALNRLKKRTEKPYLILVADIKRCEIFVEAHHIKRVERLTAAFWPGPLTIVLPARDNAPLYAVGKDHTVALRVPGHKGVRAILERVPALFSTSANVSNGPVPLKEQDIDPILVQEVGALVSDSCEGVTPINTGLPSTILDCTGAIPVLVREGAVSRETIEKIERSIE